MTMLKFFVVTDPGETDAFLDHFRELADDAELSLENIKTSSDGIRIEFNCAPEHLTDDLADLVYLTSQVFNAWVTDPEEV